MKQLRIVKTCGLALVVVIGVGLMMPAQVLAKFPEKPITIICPWGPGGTTDIASRVFAKHLSRVWGVTVNVVNKPGGNTVIGTMELNNAKPDGYTVMMDNRDTHLVAVCSRQPSLQDPGPDLDERDRLHTIPADRSG